MECELACTQLLNYCKFNITVDRQYAKMGLLRRLHQQGERLDNPVTVHDVNVLTVVASESYKDFVTNLQREIGESLLARPRKADEAYFTGKVITTKTGKLEISPAMSKQIYKYLLKNDYTDDADHIAAPYHEAKANGTLATLPTELVPHAEQIFDLIDSVFSEGQLPDVGDDRKPKKNSLNENFQKKEFKELWNRINKKAVYQVAFDSSELIDKCIQTLNAELRVTPLQYTIQSGVQSEQLTEVLLRDGDGFSLKTTTTETHTASAHSSVSYDLLGKIAENTSLTRKTIAEILSGIHITAFEQFKQNPENFIAESSQLINEQKATIIIEHLSYDTIADVHDISIFTSGQCRQDFSNASDKLQKHIYDYVVTDSGGERKFAKALDTSTEVVVYAKLPRGFQIPTPVGNYNPDWAISFTEGTVRHIYFVAETKGSLSKMELRPIEQTKIECAKKFFAKLNQKIDHNKVHYDVVDNYDTLTKLVGM